MTLECEIASGVWVLLVLLYFLGDLPKVCQFLVVEDQSLSLPLIIGCFSLGQTGIENACSVIGGAALAARQHAT